MEEPPSGREEQEVVDSTMEYVAKRNWIYDPCSKTSEKLVARFPIRHSCLHCREEIINAFRSRHHLPTFLRNVDSAIKAADDGCMFYEWLLDFVILSRSSKALEGSDGFFVELKSLSGKMDTDAHSVQFLTGTKTYQWPIMSFDIFTDEGNAAAPYISSRPFNRHVSSDASFQLARQWLATCDTHHERCRASARTYPPTRLINVRCGGRVDIIKVVSSHLFVPFREVRYASLSYCWGGDQAIQTSMATLERHKLGIKISNLSQTIQDAIRVTRSFGIEFLWIDSLCIVQDNPEDVAREISRMSDYFENAYICISAASAADCIEGFLQPRNGNPYHHGPFELPYRGPNNQMGSIKLVTYTDYSSSLEPGEARAWIMQESLLAPRLLWYSYRNLAWSCRQVNHSDGGPHRDKLGWHNFRERNNWADLSREARIHMDLFSMIEYWKNLVQSYSSRSLTVPTDKLPAISGIAQKYAQIISDCAYLAGIWHSPTRIRDLTPLICVQLFWTTPLCEFRFSKNLAFLREQWSRNLGGKSVHRSQEYIAPSWSWASIDGPIVYEDWGDGMAEASDFEVLDVRVDTERQQAPFGAVRSGWLSVKGRMMEFPPMNRRENVPSTEQDRPGIVFRPDTEEDVKDLYKVKQRKMQAWLLEVARIGGTGKRTTLHWAATTPKGLILVADGTNYRRIGLFSLEIGRDTEVAEPNLETAVSLMFGEPKTITII